MLTIYVSPHDQQIVTADGQRMTVKGTFVRKGGGFVSLQDYKPPSNLSDVEIMLVKRFYSKHLRLPPTIKQAVLQFLRTYHAKQDLSFDCYAFANMVKGIDVHKVPFMLKFWELFPKPWRIPIGSVVFLCSEENHFHHAAISIGSGLYISIYGAGGNLEVARLKNMWHDYKATEIALAGPRG